MKTWQIVLLGFIILIIVLIIILKPKQELSNLILTSINSFLVFGYVVATVNMVEMYKTNIGLLKMPVISTEIGFANPQEQNEIKKINLILLLMHNYSNNYATDVKVKITAFINKTKYTSTAPLDGSKNFYVQAKFDVFHVFKMEELYLTRADLSIQRMIELANEINKETQFVLKAQISHSDGFGRKINLPEISWYFNFMTKAWNLIT